MSGNRENNDDVNISVIIPAYREEKIIESTLKQYSPELRQKYGLEIILSDGGSDDNTVNLAKSLADIVVVHDADYRQTIAEGRNKGAEAARGKILLFINADTSPPDIDNFFKFISDWADGKGKYTKTDVFACKVGVSPEEKQFKDNIFYGIHNNYVRFLNFIGLGMGRGECQVLKREVFEKIGGYNGKLAAGEDFDLYKRAAKVAKISFSKELLVYESPRRFRKLGYMKTIWYWTINALAVMIKGRSASKEWEAIR